jgi:multiple sugar transport system substrate-binding protein
VGAPCEFTRGDAGALVSRESRTAHGIKEEVDGMNGSNQAWRLSRRNLLRASAITGAGALLAACAPSAGPSATQAPAKPTAVPTTAPATTLAPTAAAAAKPAATTPPAGAATPAAAGAALPDLRGKEITIAYTASTPSQLEELSKEFETRTGLKFNRVPLPYGDLYDKLIINLSQGTGLYDLTVCDGPWVPLFAGKGYVQPLDPFFEKAGLKGLDSDFVPSAVDFAKWPPGSGKIIGIDYNGNVQLYAYRKDLLEKYGLQPPRSWDDVLTFARTVKQKESGMYGYVMRGKSVNPAASAFLPCFWGFGAEMFDANYVPQFNSDKAVAALEFWVQMAKELAPPGVATFDSTEVSRSLSTGESAQSMVWPSWAGNLDDPQKSQTAGKWTWAVAPQQPGAKGGAMMGNWLLVIPRGAKNPDPAFQFLLWATGAEAQKRAALQTASPPTRASVYKDPEVIGKYPYYSSVLENLQVARSRPQITNWGAVENAFGTQISASLAGEYTPKAALESVQREVLALMKKEGYLK